MPENHLVHLTIVPPEGGVGKFDQESTIITFKHHFWDWSGITMVAGMRDISWEPRSARDPESAMDKARIVCKTFIGYLDLVADLETYIATHGKPILFQHT